MKLKVLLVDGDQSRLVSYQVALADMGFEPVMATNGLECLAALRAHRPDVLVLDTEIPWGSGVGVLALMREQPELSSIPVLILSASPTRIEDEVLPTIDYALLSKPVSASVVVDVVQTLTRHLRYGRPVFI